MEGITEEIIEKSICRELEKGEKEFIELFKAAEMGRITREEFRNKSSTIGIRSGMGSESSYSLGKVEVNYVRKLEGSLYDFRNVRHVLHEQPCISGRKQIPDYAKNLRKQP